VLKRFSVCFTLFLFILSLISPITYAVGEPVISAKSAVLINAHTNEIVYEKNAFEQKGMASTTKIMTALLALEYGDLNKTITAKESDVRIEGTSIGLRAGDKITLETLVKGMLLESGNDAANVTATAVSGTSEKFVSLMNKKARLLGMENTSFKNPSGLTEEGHYSTAYDMAILGSYAIKNLLFRSICSTDTIRVSYGTPAYERTFRNHNRLLKSCEGVFGIKTGFTKASGRCLVSAAERDGVILVAVTLAAPDDWQDHEKLYEYGFEKIKVFNVPFSVDTVKIPVVGSNNKYINVKLNTDLVYTSENKKSVKTIVYCEKFLYSGVNKGEVVGFVKVFSEDGTLLCKSELVSTENAVINFIKKEKTLTWFDKIKCYFGKENR